MANYRLQILDSTVNGKATLAADTALGQVQIFAGETAPSGKVCEFSTSENLTGFSLNVSDAALTATNAMSVRFWVKVAGDWVHIAERAISFTAMTDYTVYFDWPIGETSPGISNTPAPMTKAEAQAANKILVEAVQMQAKAGQPCSALDVLTLLMTNKAEAAAAIDTVANGGGFVELRLAGLSAKEAYIVLAVCNMLVDTVHYEAETALKTMLSSLSNIQSFVTWLASKGLVFKSLANIEQETRSTPEIYGELNAWAQTL